MGRSAHHPHAHAYIYEFLVADVGINEYFCKIFTTMEKAQAYIRIQELKEILTEANRKYYVENAPTLSDYEFDMLLKELEALEREYPEYITPDSPTQTVGSDLFRPADTATPKTGSSTSEKEPAAKAKRGKAEKPKKEFEQHPHRYPMLSLGNTYDITEVQEFADRAVKTIGNSFTYSCELKFDGTAICLTYENGKLVKALTRGDGKVGDDVTENVKRISNIPQELKTPEGFIPTLTEPEPWPEQFEIRGEIYMPWAAFDRLNEERISEEEQPRDPSSSSTARWLQTEVWSVRSTTSSAKISHSTPTTRPSEQPRAGDFLFQTRERCAKTSKRSKSS